MVVVQSWERCVQEEGVPNHALWNHCPVAGTWHRCGHSDRQVGNRANFRHQVDRGGVRIIFDGGGLLEER